MKMWDSLTKEEAAELQKKKDAELDKAHREANKRVQCVNSCMAIYQHFSQEEVLKMPASVYAAWMNGRDIEFILYPSDNA